MTPDDEREATPSRAAERMQDEPAGSQMLNALEAVGYPQGAVDVLDGIDGAYERAQLGLRQAHAGQTAPLDKL